MVEGQIFFKWSKADINADFSFSVSGYLTKAKEPYY